MSGNLKTKYAVSMGFLLLLVLSHLGVGTQWIQPSRVVEALLYRTGDRSVEFIVWELRVPRLLIAMVAGALLGLSGSLLQQLVGNPLVGPELSGATSGAVCAVVAAGQFTAGAGGVLRGPLIPAVAFAGALAASSCVLVLTGVRRAPLRLVLIGVMVSSVLTALTSALLLRNPGTMGGILTWLIGSLNARTWGHWSLLWPCALGCLVVAVPLFGPLNCLALGESTASALGVSVRRWRVYIFGVAAASAGSAVMIVGAIGFVGLVAPHLARRTFGSDSRTQTPGALIWGALILISADILSQLATSHVPEFLGVQSRAGLPVGATTALVGAPLLLLATRRSALRGTQP